jgi:hypothetical protein
MLLHHLLGKRWIPPKIGGFYFFFKLGQLKFFSGEVKDAPVIDGIVPAQLVIGLPGPAFELLVIVYNSIKPISRRETSA